MGEIMTSKKPLTIEEIQEIGRSSVGLKIDRKSVV
jgi:hypothetical protein